MLVYLLLLVFGPLVFAAVLSRVYQPIYFRPRFTLLLLPAFTLLASASMLWMRPRALGWLLAAAFCVLCLVGLHGQNRTIHKTDWRMLARAWREKGPPAHIEFFPAYDYSPALYYIAPPIPQLTKQLLSEQRQKIRNGIASFKGKEIWLCSRPGYSYSLFGEQEYYRWLKSQGRVEAVALPTNIRLERVHVGQ